MRQLLKKGYRLLVILFGFALIYSLWLRDLVPQMWRQKFDPLCFGVIALFVVVNAVWLYHHHFQYRDLKMSAIDAMEGAEFEDFCAYLLKRHGYHKIRLTQASGDQGIDIIAQKKGHTYGFQCKRYTGFVGNKAVQEVWTGHNYYQLDKAVVITNSEFSEAAIALGDELGVTLIDRPRLRRMMRRLPS